MVRTLVLPEKTYKYPIEVVIKAYHMRYHKNNKLPLLLESEVVDEREEDGVKVLVRRCCLKLEVPFILKKLSGAEHVTFTQTHRHDTRSRRMSVETVNDSFSDRVLMLEKCFYSVHPDNPDWTKMEQEATLRLLSVFGLESLVERVALKQYQESLEETKGLIEEFIKEIEETEGNPSASGSGVSNGDEGESGDSADKVEKSENVVETKRKGWEGGEIGEEKAGERRVMEEEDEERSTTRGNRSSKLQQKQCLLHNSKLSFIHVTTPSANQNTSISSTPLHPPFWVKHPLPSPITDTLSHGRVKSMFKRTKSSWHHSLRGLLSLFKVNSAKA